MGQGVVDRSEGSADRRAGMTLDDLYVRHAPAGFRLALLLTGDRALAEDLVHEAFIRVIGRLGHIRHAESFDAYLRRAVVNLTKNTWRRRALERRHGPTRASTPTVPDPATAVADHLLIWDALDLLSERQRTAVVLRYYEDLSDTQIASIMRCPQGTVRSLVSRGLASMRATMEVSADG